MTSSSSSIASSDAKSPQDGQPGRSDIWKQNTKVTKVLIGIVVCIALLDPLRSLIELGYDVLGYHKGVLPTLLDSSCGSFFGTAGPDEEIQYIYKRVGDSCDTEVERETIHGAVREQIRKNGLSLCRTQCLDLTKTGFWNGYLLIGPREGFDFDIYCGPELPGLKFGDCDYKYGNRY